jgi:exopolyphosphatase/guanosine-5'-triphosphate,3'-diphosphate pyrophosphatase
VRVAALDLGSNSFHLQVADVVDGRVDQVTRQKEMLRLGSTLAEQGRLGEEAIARAVASAAGLVEVARRHGAHRIVAGGTDALRRAPDGVELVERVRAATGVQVAVLSGDEEAELIFAAVRARLLHGRRRVLALDLGGGSLEVMVGSGAGLDWSASLPLGVARLTSQLVRSDPPSASDRDRVAAAVEGELAPHLPWIRRFAPHQAVGTAGTLLTLIRLAAEGAADDGRRLPAAPASLGALRALAGRLLAMDSGERRKLPGVEGGRADLLPAGIVACVTALEGAGLDSIIPCDWSLRDGMILAAARLPR